MTPSLCPWPPCLLSLSLCPWSWHQLHCCAPRRAPWPRQLQDIINLNSAITSSRKASLNTCSHSPAVLSASVCSTGVSPRAVLPQGTLGDVGMSVAVTTGGGGALASSVWGQGSCLTPTPSAQDAAQCPQCPGGQLALPHGTGTQKAWLMVCQGDQQMCPSPNPGCYPRTPCACPHTHSLYSCQGRPQLAAWCRKHPLGVLPDLAVRPSGGSWLCEPPVGQRVPSSERPPPLGAEVPMSGNMSQGAREQHVAFQEANELRAQLR